MAGSVETSNITNKSFYSNVFVLVFIVKLYIKKFKLFSLGYKNCHKAKGYFFITYTKLIFKLS